MISLAATTVGEHFGERLVFGLLVSVIGILMVFILLGILIFILKLFEYIANLKIEHKKSKKSKKSEETIPSTAVTEITVDNGINYDETVAAIVGALSVVLSEGVAVENPDAKFVVRSIKKFNPRRF